MENTTEYEECFILRGKVASVFGHSRLLVDKVDKVSCALLFQCCLPKIINIRSNLLKLLTKTLLAFFTLDTIKRHFR